jgi:hypothetical protein
MKKTILIIFIVLSGIMSAQDNAGGTTPKTKRFFLGINFSPDLCYRTLKNSDGTAFIKNLMDADNKNETYKFGFTSGINACYLLTKHINIEVGVQYANKGFETKESALIFGVPRSGIIYNTSNNPTSGKIIYVFNYLDIPLKVNFVFGKKKTRFITGIGLTTDILIRGTNTFKGETAAGSTVKNSSNVTGNYNRVNLSPTISCGIEHTLNSRMFFKVEPTFRYSVLKVADAPIGTYLWSAGINLSCYFL